MSKSATALPCRKNASGCRPSPFYIGFLARLVEDIDEGSRFCFPQERPMRETHAAIIEFLHDSNSDPELLDGLFMTAARDLHHAFGTELEVLQSLKNFSAAEVNHE